ncbi:MAG: DUF4280 domain-containing protein [Selenomonadaceae bacterium]|nr:DUF4280 domain-containing protein [Selenomonadaceae bacterium]MBQ4495684.1 DUF4280 domain-containing protein [Selenomonadaceae bacterium]MBQ6758683.1 DUF4280 domain-containing protein [Selenomonadaceae bacterium]MBR0101917.1 DUF4280 domain-containing protein [Selenomonadaceae bacterium]MBR6713652.1 DUF4280 domain-containing protein [Selenomonadaceae bacterium]
MADFLTERTIFTCEAAPAVGFTISMSGNVKNRGFKVLTTAAKLSGKGICPILTAMAQGVSQPCKFQQTPWINFSKISKAEGNELLKDDSFCSCSFGSVVKVRAANASNFKGQ